MADGQERSGIAVCGPTCVMFSWPSLNVGVSIEDRSAILRSVLPGLRRLTLASQEARRKLSMRAKGKAQQLSYLEKSSAIGLLAVRAFANLLHAALS